MTIADLTLPLVKAVIYDVLVGSTAHYVLDNEVGFTTLTGFLVSESSLVRGEGFDSIVDCIL